VSTAGSGTGAVTSDTGGIDCPGTLCSADYLSGTVVTLTATADAGSTFTGWTATAGACTGATTPCTVTMDMAYAVTAQFDPDLCLVTTTADSGAGSLRDILSACTCPTVTFDPTVQGQTITLMSGALLMMDCSVTIDGGSGVTIDGNNTDQIFSIAASIVVQLDHLTITGGYLATGWGGGIANAGTLTLGAATLVTGNSAGYGGGIFNDSTGTLTVLGSVNANTATTDGGGITSFGTLTVSGLVGGNTAFQGGGICVYGGTATLSGSTISANIATYGGGVYAYGGTTNVGGSTISDNNTGTNSGGGLLINSGAIVNGPAPAYSGNVPDDCATFGSPCP
jgi:hypothetical protein